MSTCRRALAEAFRHFIHRPGIFIVIQLPGLLLSLYEKLFMANVDSLPFKEGLAIIVPYFAISVIFTMLIAAMTFAVVEDARSGRKISLGESITRVWRRMALLLAASLISSIVVLLGFAAYYLPGIIIMGLYLYLPQLIMEREQGEESSRRPLMVYFNRSWRLARRNILGTACLVIATIVVTLIVYFADDGLIAVCSRLFPQLSAETNAPPTWLVGSAEIVQAILNLAGEALADLWVCCYFLHITQEGVTQ